MFGFFHVISIGNNLCPITNPIMWGKTLNVGNFKLGFHMYICIQIILKKKLEYEHIFQYTELLTEFCLLKYKFRAYSIWKL